jgi:hypothetical protein
MSSTTSEREKENMEIDQRPFYTLGMESNVLVWNV